MEELQRILKVTNLCVNFLNRSNRFQAVGNLSFALFKGQTLGIVGESGSGKSVTALAIMGLLNKNNTQLKGEILFNETGQTVNLLHLSSNEMRRFRGNRISMIFQEPMTSLNPSMLCGEQISESIRLHLKTSPSKAQKKTIELLREVDLPDPNKIYKAYPHEISGGQKQRVMIAMAIACHPDVLIADEPTTALDVTVQQTIIALLKDLQQKYGLSIIFISHDLALVKQIADQILVLYQGAQVEQQPSETLFLHPEHAYTKGLLACRTPSEGRLKRLPTVSDFWESSPQKVFISEPIEDKKWVEETDKLLSREPVMKIKNLSKRYRTDRNIFGKHTFFDALQSVSFDVYAGETLGLVGESGCGKTTLGRSLLRLIEPSGGTIIFKDIDIAQLSPRQLKEYRKEVQIIFQDPFSSLNPRRTAGEALTEPMKLHQIGNSTTDRKQKAIQLLERVGLEAKHFYSYPHEFSGGQRQRICIARALSVNPSFIICDESVSALDVSVQAQILNLLNDLKKSFHLTYIFISHDLSVVRYMSHRVMVIKNGRIQELAYADTLYKKPQNPYSQQLINAIPRM